MTDVLVVLYYRNKYLTRTSDKNPLYIIMSGDITAESVRTVIFEEHGAVMGAMESQAIGEDLVLVVGECTHSGISHRGVEWTSVHHLEGYRPTQNPNVELSSVVGQLLRRLDFQGDEIHQSENGPSTHRDPSLSHKMDGSKPAVCRITGVTDSGPMLGYVPKQKENKPSSRDIYTLKELMIMDATTKKSIYPTIRQSDAIRQLTELDRLHLIEKVDISVGIPHVCSKTSLSCGIRPSSSVEGWVVTRGTAQVHSTCKEIIVRHQHSIELLITRMGSLDILTRDWLLETIKDSSNATTATLLLTLLVLGYSGIVVNVTIGRNVVGYRVSDPKEDDSDIISTSNLSGLYGQ